MWANDFQVKTAGRPAVLTMKKKKRREKQSTWEGEA